MDQLSERLQTPISTAELERRWAAVRAAMERDKIDVLLMQNNNDHMGGYVKYFTDLPAGTCLHPIRWLYYPSRIRGPRCFHRWLLFQCTNTRSRLALYQDSPTAPVRIRCPTDIS